MKSYPRINDVFGDFSGECIRPGATKELHQVNRGLSLRKIQTPDAEDVLLDELGIPILDEVTDNVIFDTYPHTLA